MAGGPTPNDSPGPAPRRTIIIIEAVADPMFRSHGVNRDPDYRLRLLLKDMLRQLGFRCVSARPDRTPEPPAPAEVAGRPAAG